LGSNGSYRSRRWMVAPFATAVLISAVATAGGQPPPSELLPATPATPGGVENISWRGEIENASRLEVYNRFGDVRLRFGGTGRMVEVTAAVQQLDPSGSRLEVTVDDTSDPATVSVVRNQPKGSNPDGGEVDRSRADLVVLVPAGLAVVARGERGLVDCRGLESDVDLATVSGPIRVRSTSGRVTAHSDRGEIAAVLTAGVTEAPQSLETITGSIEVWVNDTAALDVTLATSGRLTSDFSMQVSHHDREEPDKVATVKVGAGGRHLELASRRGDLALRRLMAVEELTPGAESTPARP
jgi:hypothetical protein